LPTSRQNFPFACHELASAVFRGTDETDERTRHPTLPIAAGKRKGYEFSAMKSMMVYAGLVGGPVRPPLVDLKSDEVKALRTTMKHWKPWL